MDRARRLEDGQPPLRVSEVAEIIGYSNRYVRKLMDAEAIAVVGLPGGTERRVPVFEVRRLAHQLGIDLTSGQGDWPHSGQI